MDRDQRAVHAEPVGKEQQLRPGIGHDRQATGERDGAHPASLRHYLLVSAAVREPAKVTLLEAEQLIIWCQRGSCQLAGSPGKPGIGALRDTRGHTCILPEKPHLPIPAPPCSSPSSSQPPDPRE